VKTLNRLPLYNTINLKRSSGFAMIEESKGF
jgi:hypothetical protein